MTELELRRGDVLLGTLRMHDVDQPQFMCTFKPTEEFEKIKSLFEQELAILEDPRGFDVDTWEEAYSKIDELGLRLVFLDDGREISDFILHIDGQGAWFRY